MGIAYARKRKHEEGKRRSVEQKTVHTHGIRNFPGEKDCQRVRNKKPEKYAAEARYDRGAPTATLSETPPLEEVHTLTRRTQKRTSRKPRVQGRGLYRYSSKNCRVANRPCLSMFKNIRVSKTSVFGAQTIYPIYRRIRRASESLFRILVSR